jgi:hypothetical protein
MKRKSLSMMVFVTILLLVFFFIDSYFKFGLLKRITSFFRPVAIVSSEMGKNLTSGLGNVSSIGNLQHENKELKGQLNTALQEIARLSEAQKENISLKNELNYTASTWAEWTKANAVGDSTGLEFTMVDSAYAIANISTNFKPSTKYGILINVSKNELVTKSLYMDTTVFTVANAITSTGVTGNKKIVATTQNSIVTNKLYIQSQNTTGDAGLKAKLKDIRIFELPIGSEIESDFNTKTADELAQKYAYIKGNNIKSSNSGRFTSTKNRFNKYRFKNQSIKSDVTVSETMTGIRITGTTGSFRTAELKLQLEPNTSYKIQRYLNIISGCISSTDARIMVYNSTTSTVLCDVLKSIANDTQVSFTTQSDGIVDIILYAVGSTSGNGDVEFNNLQITKDDSVYSPYASGGQAYIPADWKGQSVGSAKDLYDLIRGVGTKNVGNVVLNGTLPAEYITGITYGTNSTRFRIFIVAPAGIKILKTVPATCLQPC